MYAYQFLKELSGGTNQYFERWGASIFKSKLAKAHTCMTLILSENSFLALSNVYFIFGVPYAVLSVVFRIMHARVWWRRKTPAKSLTSLGTETHIFNESRYDCVK